MENKKIKWLIYTVLVGFIPIISRLLAWSVTKDGLIEMLSPADFIVFGLVLHISNINEIEHFSEMEHDWKTIYNGLSIAFIAFYSVLLTISLITGDSVNINSLTYCSISLSTVSFMLSYSIYYKLSKCIPIQTRIEI